MPAASNHGFALVELLIVIGIIGNIAGIILVASDSVRERAYLANLYSYSSSVAHQLSVACIGQWEFNEGSGGTAADSCAGHSGTLLPDVATGPAWTTGTNNTSALDFDGVDDGVRVNNVGLYNPTVGFTIEAFVYPRSTSTHDIFFSASLPYVSRNGSGFYFRWRDAAGAAQALGQPTGSISANQWYHVLATHDGTTARLYVNGELVATSNSTSLSTTVPTTYYIGRHTSGAYNFDGIVDAVHFYNEPHIQR